jgi:hypothetical protein
MQRNWTLCRGIVSSAVLIRIAKHLALLACLMIMSEASGYSQVSELSVFLLIVTAACAYSLGRSLKNDLFTRSTQRFL